MEKEFVPYELALRLKKLGFDEPCFSWHASKTHGLAYGKVIKSDLIQDAVLAPTFSQAFRWFSDKHNLHGELYTVDMGAIEYCFQIRDLYSENYIYDNFMGAGDSYSGTFDSFEESELECLKKLIKIIENKIQ